MSLLNIIGTKLIGKMVEEQKVSGGELNDEKPPRHSEEGQT